MRNRLLEIALDKTITNVTISRGLISLANNAISPTQQKEYEKLLLERLSRLDSLITTVKVIIKEYKEGE